MNIQSNQKGFIKIIILIIVGLLILSYFGISLRSVINSPVTQDNISYTTTGTVSFWNAYLKQPATYLWNQVFINLIWDPAMESIKNIGHNKINGTSTATSTP